MCTAYRQCAPWPGALSVAAAAVSGNIRSVPAAALLPTAAVLLHTDDWALGAVLHTAVRTRWAVLHTDDWTLGPVLHTDDWALGPVLHTADRTRWAVLHTAIGSLHNP